MAGLALRSMLAGAIDYAGCFPPASLPLPSAGENFLEYRAGFFSWMLGRFVVRAQDAAQLPNEMDGALAVVGTDHPRAAAVEIQSVAHFDKPTYCEVPVKQLTEVRNAGSFAKLRTGGLTQSAIPHTRDVAEFLEKCTQLNLPFKATAGLHHPLRGSYPLTYANDSPAGCMLGFINLLFAGCWLWSGDDPSLVPLILDETDGAAFRFDDQAWWREHALSVAQLERARREFIHSFGSCSFEEPIHDLQELGWL